MADEALSLEAIVLDRFSAPIRDMSRQLRQLTDANRRSAVEGTGLAKAHGESFTRLRESVSKTSEVFRREFAPMLKGVAEEIHVKPDDPMTVYDWIKEAHGQGAKFWACPANLELFGKNEADLIPECNGVMGAAAMIQDVMGDDCRVLTF